MDHHHAKRYRLFRPTCVALAILGLCLAGATGRAETTGDGFEPYRKPGELAPLPEHTATLYRAPWRANVRVVSAAAVRDGVGVYYKHTPNEWSIDDHAAVLKQLHAAGIRRARLVPHHAIFITPDWTPEESRSRRHLEKFARQMVAAKRAGIRPLVGFPHILPYGEPGTRELQEWWGKGELLPVGPIGSAEWQAYLDKTWQALRAVLEVARDAGFTDPGSYDLDMGFGLWWGAPATPHTPPGLAPDSLEPGGLVYEFDRALIRRLGETGYDEPVVRWKQNHHHFEHLHDRHVPPEAHGRSISFYGTWTGVVGESWETGTQYDKPEGPQDMWPPRPGLRWAHAAPPRIALARPEGWMADFTRHDNLIRLIRRSELPLAIGSLGVVPRQIPDARESPRSGWEMKAMGTTRQLAFWLNQGAEFVLLHSAYEPRAKEGGEFVHSLIANPIDPASFKWTDSEPLRAVKQLADVLGAGEPVAARDPGFEFAHRLADDAVLIPASGDAGPLRASDVVAILPCQLSAGRYAIAVYIVTPDIAEPLDATRMTLRLGVPLTEASAVGPVGATGDATVTITDAASGTVEIPVSDAVTWLVVETSGR